MPVTLSHWSFVIPLIALISLTLARSAHSATFQALPAGFHEATTSVGHNSKLHYARGGKGELVVLVHGFAETARMWRPMLKTLGQEYTVIAPDLPGLGGSSPMPNGQYDMKSVAQQLHELVKRLGFSRVRLVGHDIGMMAVYAYAAQYPNEVQNWF